MTTWPNIAQCVPVSTRMRPVTQVAEVAVNRLVRNGVGSPERDAAGRHRRPAPSRMMKRNTRTISRPGRMVRNGLPSR
ncbi:MAG: hypothetical protein ACLU3I_07360 [Acutalibacteraceae bacterium]